MCQSENTQGREEEKSGATDTRGRVAITRCQNTHLDVSLWPLCTMRWEGIHWWWLWGFTRGFASNWTKDLEAKRAPTCKCFLFCTFSQTHSTSPDLVTRFWWTSKLPFHSLQLCLLVCGYRASVSWYWKLLLLFWVNNFVVVVVVVDDEDDDSWWHALAGWSWSLAGSSRRKGLSSTGAPESTGIQELLGLGRTEHIEFWTSFLSMIDHLYPLFMIFVTYNCEKDIVKDQRSVHQQNNSPPLIFFI